MVRKANRWEGKEWIRAGNLVVGDSNRGSVRAIENKNTVTKAL